MKAFAICSGRNFSLTKLRIILFTISACVAVGLTSSLV